MYDELAMRRAGIQLRGRLDHDTGGAEAAVEAIAALRGGVWTVRSLQQWHAGAGV